MADQWYFASDNEKFGPFSAAQLMEAAALGRLRPTDTVWKEGMEKGVLAAKVKNLFPDYKAKALSPMPIVPELKEPSSSLKPSNSLASSTSNTPAKLDPWLHSTNNQVTPDDPLPVTRADPLQEIIPDGLMLKGIPDQNDSTFPVSPARINSPASEKIVGAIKISTGPPRARKSPRVTEGP
jgi:hypothetical protein